MDPGLKRAIERFPELAGAIQHCFDGYGGFREICNDYAEALDALQRWQASDGHQKAVRIAEYRELAAALESEIVAELQHATEVKKEDLK